MDEQKLAEIEQRYQYVIARRPVSTRGQWPVPELVNLLADVPALIAEIRKLHVANDVGCGDRPVTDLRPFNEGPAI